MAGVGQDDPEIRELIVAEIELQDAAAVAENPIAADNRRLPWKEHAFLCKLVDDVCEVSVAVCGKHAGFSKGVALYRVLDKCRASLRKRVTSVQTCVAKPLISASTVTAAARSASRCQKNRA